MTEITCVLKEILKYSYKNLTSYIKIHPSIWGMISMDLLLNLTQLRACLIHIHRKARSKYKRQWEMKAGTFSNAQLELMYGQRKFYWLIRMQYLNFIAISRVILLLISCVISMYVYGLCKNLKLYCLFKELDYFRNPKDP